MKYECSDTKQPNCLPSTEAQIGGGKKTAEKGTMKRVNQFDALVEGGPCKAVQGCKGDRAIEADLKQPSDRN